MKVYVYKEKLESNMIRIISTSKEDTSKSPALVANADMMTTLGIDEGSIRSFRQEIIVEENTPVRYKEEINMKIQKGRDNVYTLG